MDIWKLLQERAPAVYDDLQAYVSFASSSAESLAASTASASSDSGNRVSSSTDDGGSSENADVRQQASSISSGIGMVEGAIMNTAQVVAENVITAAHKVGSTLSSVVSELAGADLAQITSAALNAIGLAAGVFPFLVPVQIALRDLGIAVQGAVFNREAARMLTQRCADCSLMMNEMAPKIAQLTNDPSEQQGLVAPLAKAIHACSDFLAKFTKRGFLYQLMSSSKDRHALSNLDKGVTDSLQTLSVRISGFQMQLQVADTNKLDEIFIFMQESFGTKLDQQQAKSPIDPDVLAEIALKAGCETKEALKNELEPFGVAIEQISQNVLNMMINISKIDKKIDSIQEEVVDIAHIIYREIDAVNEKTDDMMDLLKTLQAESTHASSVTLAMMQEIALKNGAHIQEKFSTAAQAMKLSKKANELKSRGLNVLLIHSNGIGLETYEGLNGRAGFCGTPGRSALRALDGGNNRLDGDNGKDGK